jgi:hypothetical protein
MIVSKGFDLILLILDSGNVSLAAALIDARGLFSGVNAF